ncbi:hypothetical protein GUJ93_ZPchr0014g47208 [Zizania palustris]|uniref:Uncharacterized protein n=1 Tax=Zizania palustris TaxID=103762 RepID=A0A8J5T8R4_ZIZPA|nr:hypothetical protein GUJ93_ZPchr0137g29186 [Zizania palustris]KAG8083082.1 hypothetical protein GUJ93_ZPchr0014g47208 [Zizania palustris]
MAAPVYSITRAEIQGFWRRRKEMEEEEHRLTAEKEKETARIKAKTLTIGDYVLFEQMIREILEDNEDYRAWTERGITMNGAAATNSTEGRVGIKHWWRKSAYAYLNEPAVTSMDENGTRKDAIKIKCNPQERCMGFFSSIPSQPSTAAFAIF